MKLRPGQEKSLRCELRNYQTPGGKISARDLNKSLSPKSKRRLKVTLEYAGSERGQGDTDLESNYSHPSYPEKWGKTKDDLTAFSSPARSFSGGSPSRTSLSLRNRGPLESLILRNAGDGVAITTFGKMEQELADSVAASFHLMSKSVDGILEEKYPAYKDRHMLLTNISKTKLARIEKRAPRVSRPPPKPSSGAFDGTNTTTTGQPPAPPPLPGAPPPPPLPPDIDETGAKKDTSSLISTTSNTSDARRNMIGEIENRSSFLLAVKADVETQGDFVESLATEVRATSFNNIEDLVAFVNWLDEELSLVDERAVSSTSIDLKERPMHKRGSFRIPGPSEVGEAGLFLC
ncbi:Protein CHUP1 [Hibiscus syriacus]|uniref:Protein CHUP1 n=1 Tax=Hibiscus syriacus TaxID=106335 RepID=A0A6A3ARN9_HIBSY|nr:Protein CHUP1 [Hibiscus syriacus]